MLVFVRHGESIANAGGITMPHPDIPLTALGQSQAQAIADCIGFKAASVLASQFVRSQETAKPYCLSMALPLEVDARLNEFSSLSLASIVGMEGTQRRRLAAAYWQRADPWFRTGDGADTFVEFAQRVAEFREAIPQLPSRVAIFGHGIWLGMLIWQLLGFASNGSDDMRAFRHFQQKLPMSNGVIYRLNREGRRWEITHL